MRGSTKSRVNNLGKAEQLMFWESIIKEYEQSNLSIKEFCSKNNLNISSFRNRRFRMNKLKTSNKSIPLKPAFFPLVLNDQITSSSTQATLTHNIELRFGSDGIHVNIPSQFNVDAVSNLLTIVRKIKC